MNNQEIKEMLAKQLGSRLISKKKEIDKEMSILDGIVHSDLPVYRKWEVSSNNRYIGLTQKHEQINQIFKICLKNGRVEVDRISFKDHRVEFDSNNASIVISSDFVNATFDEWSDSMFKLMDYING
tara:strand:+ start:291 stop:668 length:378 start_codon:yes stop_codon:yes gene_type:complete